MLDFIISINGSNQTFNSPINLINIFQIIIKLKNYNLYFGT